MFIPHRERLGEPVFPKACLDCIYDHTLISLLYVQGVFVAESVWRFLRLGLACFDIINTTSVAQSPAMGLMHLSRVTPRKKNLVLNLDFISFC